MESAMESIKKLNHSPVKPSILSVEGICALIITIGMGIAAWYILKYGGPNIHPDAQDVLVRAAASKASDLNELIRIPKELFLSRITNEQIGQVVSIWTPGIGYLSWFLKQRTNLKQTALGKQ